jgi:uncharacterized protein YjdB
MVFIKRNNPIIFLFLFIFSCKNIDNPISLFILKKGNEILIYNEQISQVKNISIETAKITLKVNEEKILLANVSFKDGNTITNNNNILWSSDDKSIAEVNKFGIIKGISPGETGIAARYIDDKKIFRVIVKVTE